MDEDFEYFLETMGPAIDRRDVPPSIIEHYRGKLPAQLLAYWAEHGWCGYADGLFWTVNPMDYEPALDAWIGDTEFMKRDAYHIIARGAFGQLYLWGEKTGDSLYISAPDAYCIPGESILVGAQMNLGVQVFFSSLERDENDFDGLFSDALEKLGQLEYDEMYGFVPALALGGRATVGQLQRLKAVEHLVLLAQVAPLGVLSLPPP